MKSISELSSQMDNSSIISADMVTSSIMPATMVTITSGFGAITAGYNNQYNALLDMLNSRRAELAQTVQSNLANNPNYTGSRNAGVKLAWQYEKADIEMGGRGSANWSYEERQQILHSETGTVSGAEGHHQKNVVDHPEHQANPDNIKFYKSKQDHLNEGHGGNFQNESDAEMIDKNKMLERTNNRRVLRNELKGAGISAIIGFGVAFSISAVVELATVGLDNIEISELISHSVRAGIEGGITSAILYGSGRIVSNFLQGRGIDIMLGRGFLINYAAVGVVSIALVSTIQFIKLKMNGVETTEAFKQVGKNALFSTSVLAVSIIAQGMYGGCAGLIVSTSIGLMVLTVSVVDSYRKRMIENKLKEYVIEQYVPSFVEG